MRKVVFLLSLVFILIFNLQAIAAEGQSFSIEADGYVIFDESSNVIKAQDNVVIKSGKDKIKADYVVANIAKKEITAQNNVVLMQGRQTMSGDKLKYNYKNKKGKFYNAESNEQGAHFEGGVININNQELLVEDSTLTYCQYDDSHYEIKSEQIEVTEEGKIIATGVELWVKGKKIMPLPKYVIHVDEEERKKYAIPEPKIGYNNDDGLYLEVDYDHYINENLEGHIFTKVARKSTDILELDYKYDPEGFLELDTYLDYNRKFGLGGDIILNNKFGSSKSRLEVESFFEEDEDDGDYKENTTKVNWDLKRKGPDLSVRLRRDEDDYDQKMDKKVIVTDDLGAYYWRIQGSEDSDENYKPEVWFGTKNKSLIANTTWDSNIKVGRIYEAETKVDTVRKQFNLSLKNNKIELSDTVDLYWNSKYSFADYDTEDRYQTYGFNLGSNQDFFGANLNLDYQFYDTRGETPFNFDQLTDPELGQRHYISARLKDKRQLRDDLSFHWELRGNSNYYELDSDYFNAGMLLGADYQINDYHNLKAVYRHQIKGDDDTGVAPLDEDETEWQNELQLTYKFATDKKEFPYWDVEVNTLYNFAPEEDEEAVEELNLDFVREFDCFKFNIGFDIPDKGIDFGIDLKY